MRNRGGKDLIAPVRTRGSIRTRSGDVADKVRSTPVRTRGAIRTRGAVTTPSPTLKVERSLTLEVLVQEVREQVGGWPLTILVHGWGSQPAEEFLAVLSPLLRREDALWLIPAKEAQDPTPPEVEGVLLDLDQDTDQRTYRNLVGDIVFFPALEEAKAEQVAEWQQRARAAIIDSRGPQVDAVLRAGCETMLMTYRWSGAAALEEYAIS